MAVSELNAIWYRYDVNVSRGTIQRFVTWAHNSRLRLPHGRLSVRQSLTHYRQPNYRRCNSNVYRKILTGRLPLDRWRSARLAPRLVWPAHTNTFHGGRYSIWCQLIVFSEMLWIYRVRNVATRPTFYFAGAKFKMHPRFLVITIVVAILIISYVGTFIFSITKILDLFLMFITSLNNFLKVGTT